MDSSKLTAETPTMVTSLADRFLSSPASPSDIYHLDTGAVGEPWGAHTNPYLIPWDNNSTITILLADLNASYYGAVTVGYYWSKDNYASAYLPGSNQRIMFYIDSTLYAQVLSGESGWAPTNYWPKIVFSTLAHEFQHMIQFYQKQVIHNEIASGTETWINEMCSQIMEDLVADKLGVEGPRGVAPTDPTAGTGGNTAGRIPIFNQNMSLGLIGSSASYSLDDYSTSYAFGAWLSRNFGGAELLRRIVQDPATDSSCVTNAVAAYTGKAETMPDLLDRWAVSILGSNRTDMPRGYRYNNGNWFTSSENGINYNLGSLSFWNYSPAPQVLSPGGSLPSEILPAASNVYYRASNGLSQNGTWTVQVPEGVSFSVYITN